MGHRVTGLEIFGWAGSALLVYSLLQARVMRFRVLNLIASIALTAYNWFLEVWPMVGMNLVIAAIDVYFIVKLWNERHDDETFSVVEVGPHDAFLDHVLAVHRDEIKQIFPQSEWATGHGERSAYVVLRGDETVGVVLLRETDSGVAEVDVDFVTLKYRDFCPGEFVFTESGLFAREGFRTVLTPPGMRDAYYGRLGFTVDGDRYRIDVPASS